MLKYTILALFAVIACAAGKPHLLGAPLVAAPAPLVTAASHQVVARNFNGIAAAPILAPLTGVVAAPVAHIAPVAHVAPVHAHYAAAAHVLSPWGYASPYAAPLHYHVG